MRKKGIIVLYNKGLKRKNIIDYRPANQIHQFDYNALRRMQMIKLIYAFGAIVLSSLPFINLNASANNNEMPGLEGERGTIGVPAKAPPSSLDDEIKAEKEKAQKLAEEEKRKELAALKAKNQEAEKKLTSGQKVGRETDRVLKQVGGQFKARLHFVCNV